MILVDTSVLCYAVGEEHLLRTPCRRLLRAHADERIEVTTTIEVVQEFLHVRARRRPRADAVAVAGSYASAFDLLTTDESDLRLALDLFERHEPLGAFDAVLAAVALNRSAEALVSADQGFGSVPGLRWIDPRTTALTQQLGV